MYTYKTERKGGRGRKKEKGIDDKLGNDRVLILLLSSVTKCSHQWNCAILLPWAADVPPSQQGWCEEPSLSKPSKKHSFSWSDLNHLFFGMTNYRTNLSHCQTDWAFDWYSLNTCIISSLDNTIHFFKNSISIKGLIWLKLNKNQYRLTTAWEIQKLATAHTKFKQADMNAFLSLLLAALNRPEAGDSNEYCDYVIIWLALKKMFSLENKL